MHSEPRIITGYNSRQPSETTANQRSVNDLVTAPADQLEAFEQALADRRRDMLDAMERSNAELVAMVGRYVAELRSDLADVADAIESAVRHGS